MRHLLKTHFPCVLVLMVVLLLLSSGANHANASAPRSLSKPACSGWNQISNPNPSGLDALNTVAVASANDVWAAGDFSNDGTIYYTLIEHWDGSSWSVVPSSNPAPSINILNGVAVVTANDVWAVGYSSYSTQYLSPTQTLIDHWNGTSWKVVPSPNLGPNINNLYGVAVVSANDVWAVGYYRNFNYHTQTLIEHWDGSSWSIVPTPSSVISVLNGVAVASANDVWAVGSTSSAQTLTEHWNGSTWSIIPSPSRKRTDNTLYAAATVPGTNQVLTVGSFNHGSKFLTEHWNGSKWSVVPMKSFKNYTKNTLLGITSAGGPNTVFAVGFNQNQPDSPPFGIIEQWNGSKWQVSDNSFRGELTAVAWVPGSKHLWAVGSDVYQSQTLIVYYC